MVKDRIKEVLDFARTESPYKSANKGWINDDVYLQFGNSVDQLSLKGEELAEVSVLWRPINQLALTLLFVVLLACIFVFSTVSLSHGKIHLFKSSQITILNSSPEEVTIETSSDVVTIETVDEEMDSSVAAPLERVLPSVEPTINQIEQVQTRSTSEITKSLKAPQVTRKLVTAQDLLKPKKG